MLKVLVLLVILFAARYLVPELVAEISYAVNRGRVRAEYQQAGITLNGAGLGDLSRAYEQVFHRVAPSVVHINTASPGRRWRPRDEADFFFLPPPGESRGQGSGVIVDADGYVVTNNHVVQGASRIDVVLSDGRSFPGRVLGQDPLTDLALIKIDARQLIAAEWGDSDRLQEGGLVWAVGSPFGLERSITTGILSAKNRSGQAGNPYQEFLQTDAAVNPGNSGGPLVDVNGRLVGIITAIVGPVNQGISFAIPSLVARDVYERLRQEGRVARGWLGVSLQAVTPELAAQLGLTQAGGALVTGVVASGDQPSPAAEAGLRAGDVVLRWNDQPIDSPTALSRAVASTAVGAEVEMVIAREGRETTLKVRVGDRPSQL